MTRTSPKIGFVSLGCPKALVDSERILTQLRAEGYELVPSYGAADLVVVNTCGSIEAAVDESLDAIGEALKENGRVVVTGCLGARADLVRQRHPGVLAVSGPQRYEEVVRAVHQQLPPRHDPFLDLLPPQGIKLTPRHYAYLKISEGCNHRCSFCIIPSMRGDLVSRPVGDAPQEAERLAAAGVRELLVISQDTSAYGVETRYAPSEWRGRSVRTRLFDLADALGELGIWVRLHYVYPYPHVDEITPLMAAGRILPYLDVPLQHASPRILRLMKRPAAAEGNVQRIRAWREVCPEITLRSTFIVGFPGENDEDFAMLLDFLKEAQLDRVGCFKYSPVDGAAANALFGAVSQEVKDERYRQLMETQAAISRTRLAARVGSRMQVLLDEVRGDTCIARGPGDAPEIDDSVLVEGAVDMKPGDLVDVQITSSGDHDLWAVPMARQRLAAHRHTHHHAG